MNFMHVAFGGTGVSPMVAAVTFYKENSVMVTSKVSK